MATSASIDSTHINLPMASTNISMVAKTVIPGTSPPSTTAGSTRDTVLNETAFDVSERRETVNRVGREMLAIQRETQDFKTFWQDRKLGSGPEHDKTSTRQALRHVSRARPVS